MPTATVSKLDKPKLLTRRLIVRAYPDLRTWTVPDVRNVYLVRLNEPAFACDLYDVDVPLASVLELVEWAKSVGIEVVADPVGCLVAGFVWPQKGYAGLVPPKRGGKPVHVFHDDGAFTEVT
jgi:hypothetical protein